MKVSKESTVIVNNKEFKTQSLVEMTAAEQSDQLEFTLKNIIKFDKNSANIHKFISDVYDKLFSEANIIATGMTISQRLVKGDEAEKIGEDLIRHATAETAIDKVSLSLLSKSYDQVFKSSIGKDIVTEFAANMLAQVDKNLSAQDLRMMAYSSANKVTTKELANHFLASESLAVRSAAAGAIAQVAMSVIAMKGKLDETAWLNLGVSGVAAYGGSYVASTTLTYVGMAGSSLLGAGLLTGLATGGIEAVVSLALTSLVKFNRKEVSTYIDSRSVRLTEDGKLEFVTMRPHGTL